MLPADFVLNETYRIERLLGHGGMAAVYLVRHTRLPLRFALKILSASMACETKDLERFRREAEILARLNHPHIVTVLDWNVFQDQYPYLVMELLEGHDLAQHMVASGPLSPGQALPIFLQVAEALDAAHCAGIVHRDLKPANVFLCTNGPFPNYVKVLDFGIAKVLRTEGPNQTQPATIMGTPAYMSPEQAMGDNARIDARTDQFALASVLYEMLAGRPAFWTPGESTLHTLTRVVAEEPAPLSAPQLDAVIRRALAKDPAQRFPTLREFIDATGAVGLSTSVPIVHNQTRPTPPTLPPADSSISASFEQVKVPPQPTLIRRRWQRRPWIAISMVVLPMLGGLSAVAVKHGMWRSGTATTGPQQLAHKEPAPPPPPTPSFSALPPAAAAQAPVHRSPAPAAAGPGRAAAQPTPIHSDRVVIRIPGVGDSLAKPIEGCIRANLRVRAWVNKKLILFTNGSLNVKGGQTSSSDVDHQLDVCLKTINGTERIAASAIEVDFVARQ